MKKYDLAVIGGGMGGYGTAIYGAKHGLNTCLIEHRELGGTCLNRGCIPTKVYLETIHRFTSLFELEKFAIISETSPDDFFKIDLDKLRSRKERIVNGLVSGVERLVRSAGIDYIKGFGEINPDKTITVNNELQLMAENIVIATGSEPLELPGFPFDGQRILSSDHALELDIIPKNLAIIGGGAIGCEFAEIYSGLGSKVTIFEMLPGILPGMDSGIIKRFTPMLKKKGITINTGTRIEKVEKTETGVELTYSDRINEFDAVLVSVGRQVNLKGLTENLDCDERGYLKVNKYQKTNVEGIYGIGDVTGVQMLAHSAVAMGQIAILDILGRKTSGFNPLTIPFVVYTDPELAGVGLTEDQAREKFENVKTGNFTFRALGRALAEESPTGMVKVVGTDDKILGIHIFGKSAGELIHSAVPFISQDIKLDSIYKTVFAHPTLSEGVKEAFEDLMGVAIHTISRKRN